MAIAVLGSSVNAPTVMLANFVATPLELSLMVVFLRFGEFVTGGAHFPLTTDALKKVLTGEASTEIFRSILSAVVAKRTTTTTVVLRGGDGGGWRRVMVGGG
ncbi:hypothetical protein Hdeb2414_s0010g00350791 [Helianthus debilis subsp. tardiflorus]